MCSVLNTTEAKFPLCKVKFLWNAGFTSVITVCFSTNFALWCHFKYVKLSSFSFFLPLLPFIVSSLLFCIVWPLACCMPLYFSGKSSFFSSFCPWSTYSSSCSHLYSVVCYGFLGHSFLCCWWNQPCGSTGFEHGGKVHEHWHLKVIYMSDWFISYIVLWSW